MRETDARRERESERLLERLACALYVSEIPGMSVNRTRKLRRKQSTGSFTTNIARAIVEIRPRGIIILHRIDTGTSPVAAVACESLFLSVVADFFFFLKFSKTRTDCARPENREF